VVPVNAVESVVAIENVGAAINQIARSERRPFSLSLAALFGGAVAA
jgi:hypothetical protein